ncbi:2-isopropylmalate synthase [Patescibacteria group bacterium]
MKKREKVLIFDTTLRDGEQSPGAVLKPEQKVEIAVVLEELGVDIIEAGFPVSSPGDFKAVENIAKKMEKPIVCSLARAMEQDIKVAWQAVKKAKKPRIHVFIGTSRINLKGQLRKSQNQLLEIIKKRVKQAKSYTKDIEFSPMDATRTDFKFLCLAVKTALTAGATTINIADTVGYALPHEFGRLIKSIKKSVAGLEKANLSVHCHNDLGLATANSLAAIKAGANQVECTINGIGERAGNTSLEEIAMILKVRQKQFKVGTNIVTEKIYPTSRLVSKLTNMVVQPNKALVGRNAFAHASGIHQDGFLKEKQTIEIMQPQDIGLKSSRIVLGARSGKHALKYRLSLLNIFPTDEELKQIYEKFLKVADRKRIVTKKDLLAIMKKL